MQSYDILKITIILSSICVYVSMFEVTFEKAELTYCNKKYFNMYNFTLRRAKRRSPYIFNLYQDVKTSLGNNMTYKWKLYEVISGREILTPVQFTLYLCDGLYNDPYIGKMFANQLPKNWTCPFPPGYNNWTNIALNFNNWPRIPFTYSSLIVRTCTTIDGYINNELVHQGKVYAVVKQEVEDKSSKQKKSLLKEYSSKYRV